MSPSSAEENLLRLAETLSPYYINHSKRRKLVKLTLSALLVLCVLALLDSALDLYSLATSSQECAPNRADKCVKSGPGHWLAIPNVFGYGIVSLPKRLG
jgi:hypothetical protein